MSVSITLCVLLLATPEVDNWSIAATGVGSSSRWYDGVRTDSTTYKDIRNYAARPAEIPKSLAVNWDKPQFDLLGNIVTLRGTVLRDSDNHKPVDWFQGVSVYLAKIPGWKADWTKGIDESSGLAKNVLLTPKGRFRITLHVRDFEHNHRTGPASYQVALALASHRGQERQRVEWKSSNTSLQSTISQLSIPAAPKIDKNLALINAVCSTKATGADLVRVVNGLKPLGKQRALALLEEYLQKTKSDQDDKFGVFWIIRLLFEPKNAGEKIPVPAIWVYGPSQTEWPLTPLASVFDVPFTLALGGGFGGLPEHPTSHIGWARRAGQIREDNFTPIDPLSAVEFVIRSRRFAKLQKHERGQLSTTLRTQAIRMLELNSMPGVEPALQKDLLKKTNSPWENLRKPFPKELRKRFKWEKKRSRFMPSK